MMMEESKFTEKNELEALVKKLVQQELNSRMSHECWCCDWLQFSNKPNLTRNRYCQNPEKMVLDKRGFCIHWIIASDLGKRVKGNFTV